MNAQNQLGLPRTYTDHDLQTNKGLEQEKFINAQPLRPVEMRALEDPMSRYYKYQRTLYDVSHKDS